MDMTNRAWLLGVALGSAACAAAPSPHGPAALAVAPSPVEAARGELVYGRFCATCHGDAGDGRGPTADRLGAPRPRDFTRGIYKFRSTEGGTLPLRSDLSRVVARGIPGTSMPAWQGVLPARDIDAVSTYLEGFSPRFADPDAPRRVVPIPSEAPQLSGSQLETGRLLFVAFRCWECHGESGRGDGPAAAGLLDDWNRPDRPADLTRARHRSGPDATDLYRTVATGLDGTKMPTFLRAVVVGREGLADLGERASMLASATLAQVKGLLAQLPSQEEIDRLDDAQRESVAQVRLWLLVGYVRSIERTTGPLDWLLLDDPRGP
jgi:mono/diheme cytochrome c family protein